MGGKDSKKTLTVLPLKVPGPHPLQSDPHLHSPWSQRCLPPRLPAPDQCSALQLQNPWHRPMLCGVRAACVCSPLENHRAHATVTSPGASGALNSCRALREWRRARKRISAVKSKKMGKETRILPCQGQRDLAQRGDVASPRS